MDVSILIVNYNTADLVRRSIQSCFMQEKLTFEIIVVDNASKDNSLSVLQSFGDKIRLIANPENSGFGQANNLAFKESRGDYLFLLNPDAEFTTSHDLADMISFMKSHPQCGLAGTRIKNGDGKETFPRYDYPGDKKYQYLFAQLPGKIAWVLGASMMIPRKIWEQTGGFDKIYFLYGDEVDWCLRIRQLGYEIGFNNQVLVAHQGSASEQSAGNFAKWTRKQEGLQVFLMRHYPVDIAKRIIRRDYWRNYFRLRMLQLITLLMGKNEKRSAKENRYRAICEAAKKILVKCDNNKI